MRGRPGRKGPQPRNAARQTTSWPPTQLLGDVGDRTALADDPLNEQSAAMQSQRSTKPGGPPCYKC